MTNTTTYSVPSAFSDRILDAVDSLTARYGCPAWLPMICQEVGAAEPDVQDTISALVAVGVLAWAKAGVHGHTDVIRIVSVLSANESLACGTCTHPGHKHRADQDDLCLSDAEVARYWSKVDKRGPDACWPWRGARTGTGYGLFYVRRHKKRRNLGAHRFAYLLAHGGIDPFLDVLHSCDTPGCQNPKHLRQGTHQENMAERNAKGRQNAPYGEQNAQHKLTQSQVADIRRRYEAEAVTQRQLGEEYGVSQVSILHVVKGKTWKQIA